MYEDVTQGVDLISTTMTGELRSRLFTAAKQIILQDGDGLAHVIRRRARVLVVDYIEIPLWPLDQMLDEAELLLHRGYVRAEFTDGEEPPTHTDDIRIPSRRPAVISNDVPF